MRAKQILAGVLALIMMLSLCACNPQEKADEYLKSYEAAVGDYIAAQTAPEKEAALERIFALDEQKEEIEAKLKDEPRKEFNRKYQELLSKAAEVA